MCKILLQTAVAGALLFALSARSYAQDFPSKPITIIVGLAAGGITDITARIYAEAVSRGIGQRVSVENKPGAGGAVGAAAVQNAAPDGYTLLVFSGSQHATIAAAGPAPYEPVKGFAPVTLLFNSVVALSVPADSPYTSVADLFEKGKKKEGGLLFGSPGLGSPSHLLGARLALAANVPIQSIHYRGGAPMMADLVTGRVEWAFPTLSTARGYLADGKLKALALDSAERWKGLPDTPTLTELGYGNEKVASWFGLAAPAGTPPAIVAKLREEFVKASRDPDVIRRLTENGTPIATSTSTDMGKLMAEETVTMEALVKTLGLKLQ
jgi:tripartite-type tricarboxylate transporter receptor subunit TctC